MQFLRLLKSARPITSSKRAKALFRCKAKDGLGPPSASALQGYRDVAWFRPMQAYVRQIQEGRGEDFEIVVLEREDAPDYISL